MGTRPDIIRVLVVEADVACRLEMTAVLNQCGFQVISADSCLQMKNIMIDPNTPQIHAVLLAVDSANGDPFSAIKDVTEFTGTPVIALLNSYREGFILSYVEAGTVYCTVKPLHVQCAKTIWQVHLYAQRRYG